MGGIKIESDKEYIKKLVKERLHSMPPNVTFSVGTFEDYTRDQLIKEIDKNSEVGEAIIEMQINFIRNMPKLLSPK